MKRRENDETKFLEPSRCMSTTNELLLTGHGEEKENASIRKLAMLTCGSREELHLVEVEHVKAHRTKKDKKYMTQFEKFATEGNEKADELAKAGTMLDEGFMTEARAKTVQHEREEVCKFMKLCSTRPAFTAQ